MISRAHLLSFSLLFLGLAACGSEEPVEALFELPRDSSSDEFFRLPYPNNLRLNDEGLVDLTGLTPPNALVEDFFDVIQVQQRGFGTTQAIFARFAGPIDPSSLPETPEESRSDKASVYLVNVEPGSESYGIKVPLQLRFETESGEIIGENWLSALPFPGFILEEESDYALVITSRVDSKSGGPATASQDFEALMSEEPSEDPAVNQARSLYAPLLAYLDEEGGDEREDVVSAAIFTTQNTTGLMGKFREVIYAELEPPVATNVRSIGDRQDFFLYGGDYDTPIFQEGEFPYQFIEQGGGFVLDESGNPVIQRTESLRFALSIPRGKAMPEAGWPIVLYAHGSGGDYLSYRQNGTAQAFAELGIAVISIDQVMHGARLESGNELTLFFNFQNPLSAQSNVMQAAIDDFQLLRLVENLTIRHDETGELLARFDPDKINFFGHSQGSNTGVPFVALEPKIKGAVFSGAGGLLFLSLLTKTEPFDITAILALIIREKPLDRFNPVLAILQAYFEPADSAAYGPLLIKRPAPGNGPKNIYQSLGFTDRFTPPDTIKALATSIGVDLVGPAIEAVEGLELSGHEVLTPPIQNNAGEVTAVVSQFNEVEGSDGHFVLFDIDQARTQSTLFIKTLVETGTATVVSP